MSLQNWWYKKEKPFTGFMGFGGGATPVTAGGAVMTPEEYFYGPGYSGSIAIPPACSTIRVAGVGGGGQGYGDPNDHTSGYPAGGGGGGQVTGFEIDAAPYRGTNISYGTPGPSFISHPTGGTLWNASAGSNGGQGAGEGGGSGGPMATGPGSQGGPGGQGGPRESAGGQGGGGAGIGGGGGGGGGHGDGAGNPGRPGGDGGTGTVPGAVTPITTNQVQGSGGPGNSFTIESGVGGEGGGPNQDGQPAGGQAGTRGNNTYNGGGGGGGGGVKVYGTSYGGGGGGGAACWQNGSSQGGNGTGGFLIVQLE